MKLTLIITTFNWPDALLLVLESIRKQTHIPDEIIIADDGSDERTKNLITKFKKQFNINSLLVFVNPFISLLTHQVLL